MVAHLPMLLRARIILPVVRPPIADGVLQVVGDRIGLVGRWADVPTAERRDVLDLGETVLLPGLINAHCHLDYTDMAGQIPPPKSFAEWLKTLVALKATWSYSEFAHSWIRGAQMLVRSGTTTVADVESVPELLPEVWGATPLRVLSLRELICVKHRIHAASMVDVAASELLDLPGGAGRVGLSPHTPYTTSPELLQQAAHWAREQGWRLVTHVAESEAEFEMFMYRQGPLFDWLHRQREMSDCGLGSPIKALERAGYLSEHLLAVHVNCLARGDVSLLARRGVQVVHCPRSHDYFKHPIFARKKLAAAGINLCLGTDSLVTVRKNSAEPTTLSLFAEMQTLAKHSDDVTPAQIVRMATLNGARALGRAADLGHLSAGALADLIAIPFDGQMAGLYENVVRHRGEVSASMIGGRWVLPPRR